MAPSPGWADYDYVVDGYENQTLRQVVHASVGGTAARITVSNVFGSQPLHIGAATIAVSAEASGSNPDVRPDSTAPVTFGGATSVVVPAGEAIVSDAVDVTIPEDHDIAVSLYLPDATGTPNGHLWAAETSHVGAGNLVDESGGTGFSSATTSSYFVTAVDVRNEQARGAVVVLGDSLSDGILAVAPDTELKWSDRLFDRVLGLGAPEVGVVNVAVAGNALHPASDPNSALARLDRDVLSRARVSTVIMLLGTNDIGADRTAAEISDGMRQVIQRVHEADVRIVGATIPPIAGPADGTCEPTAPTDPARESIRQAVNAQVRPGQPNSLGFDAVVDFDAVLRSTADGSRIRCAYSYFGTAHQNTDGHDAMSNAIDLDDLRAEFER